MRRPIEAGSTSGALFADRVARHLMHVFSGIADLAAFIDASRRHFARLFRNTLDMPPHRYVIM